MPNKSSPTGGARTARYIALAIAAPFLLLVLAFVIMPFLDHGEARLNAIGPIAPAPGIEQGGLIFSGTAGVWEIRGRMAIDARRGVHFAIDLVAPNGQPAPASLLPGLAVEPQDQRIAPVPLDVTRTGGGSYVAAPLSLPFDGRWRLRVELPDVTGVFVFDVPG